MADTLTNLLIGGAGFGRGYLDEKTRREQLMMDQRKLVMQEKAAEAETALRRAQYETDKAYHDAQIQHMQTEDTALYGDKPVIGGLRKYGIDAPGMRQEDSQDFLEGHPDFKNPTTRMTPRDKQPFSPYTRYGPYGDGGTAALKPSDIANFRLDYLGKVLQRPQGVIPPPFSVQAANADSLAGELGLRPLLQGDLTFPERTVGNVRPEANAKATQGKPVMTAENALQKQMIDMVNNSNDPPETLLRELEADVKAAPEKFKGVDLNAVRAAIRAKRGVR